MTAIHFPFDVQLAAKAPATVTWKHERPLRLDGHAIGAIPFEDHHLAFAPLSVALHAALLAAVLLVPLLGDAPPPEPAIGVRAFFAEPAAMAAPPPPPPPPAAAPRASTAKIPPPQTQNPNAFIAPVEIPHEISTPSMSLGAGGVAGGVEGGVEGGVAGGIVGGLPSEIAAPKPVAQVVRVGGDIREPKRIVYVPPEYPLLASQAGVVGLVILEAHVGTDGRVKDVTVLRSQPIFDDAAKAAVLQWRYQPLLLNGVAMEFVLSVTVRFTLRVE